MSKRLLVSISFLGVALASGVGLFGWVLASPLGALPASWLPWPVVCSTRGCVTTWDWQRQQTLAEAFAQASDSPPPTSAATLTTLVRQHLVRFATATSDVTLADAARYREEILNVSSTEQLQETLPVTLEEYDELIVLPYLAQESLRHHQRAETPADLHQKLASERLLIVLPFQLRWNAGNATVIEK